MGGRHNQGTKYQRARKQQCGARGKANFVFALLLSSLHFGLCFYLLHGGVYVSFMLVVVLVVLFRLSCTLFPSLFCYLYPKNWVAYHRFLCLLACLLSFRPQSRPVPPRPFSMVWWWVSVFRSSFSIAYTDSPASRSLSR